jgi:DNA-binding beta-propeller fold protein YncE
VLNYNPTGQGSTTEIDVSGDSNLAVNSMGVGSIAEAFPSNSLSLYVANTANDTVSQYLPTLAGAVTTISLLPGSHPVALASAQNTAMYVVNSGANCLNNNGLLTGSISTISAATLAVTNTTCVGLNPIALVQSPSDGYIYVVNQGDSSAPGCVTGCVTVFNPAGPAVTGTITTDPNPISVTVSADGIWIFVVTQGDAKTPPTLDIISSGQTTIAGTASLGVQPTFSMVDPNSNRLYVVNTGGNTVSVFDAASVAPGPPATIPLLATVPVGTGPVGVAALPNGSLFYVANGGSNDVTVVSGNSFSPLTTIALPAGANPVWIASEPTSSKIYVADKGTSETTIIQTVNNKISLNLPAPSQITNCNICALQQPVMIVTK